MELGTGKKPTRIGARALAIAVGIVTAIGGSLLGLSAAQESPSPGGQKITWTFGDTSEPSSLNPFKGYLATDFYFWAWSYHLLTDFAVDDLGAEPGLATKVDVSPDGMTYTYTIRDDVVWSDGEPVTAEDVAYTLNTYKSNHAYLPQNYLSLIDGEVEATSPTTVVFHSVKPTVLYSGTIPYLYDYILPKHVWEKVDEPKKYDNVPNVGSGPFYIAEYKIGEFVRMERNPYWTGREPHIDEIIYRIFKNEDAEAEALRTGEIDFGYFDSANIYNSLQGEPNIGTATAVIPQFDEIGMNTGSAYHPKTASFTPHGDGHPALTDVVVRRAIRMAIDNQTIVDKVWLGYAIPGDSIIPPVSVAGARWEPTGDEVIPFDLEGANALLDEAGYLDTDGDGVREMPGGGQPLELRYYVQTDDQNTVKTAPFVRSWLKQIGIKADVTAMTSGKLNDEIMAGTYDLFHWGWIPDPDPDSALSWFTCGELPPDGVAYGNDDSYYCNPEYDRMYEAQRTAATAEERWQIVHDMQKLYYEDAAYAVLFYPPWLQAWRTDTFTGYKPQPADPPGDMLASYTEDFALNVRPVSEAAAVTTETRGISAAVWIGIAVGVVVLIAAIVLVRRRRISEEDQA